jgi:transcription termination factor NusB
MCFENYLKTDDTDIRQLMKEALKISKPLTEEQRKKFIEAWDKEVKNPQAEIIIYDQQEDNVRNS